MPKAKSPSKELKESKVAKIAKISKVPKAPKVSTSSKISKPAKSAKSSKLLKLSKKNLVIVESPAKAKTIKKYLGPDFEVLASYGHVRDLLPKEGAVDTAHDFAMKYELIEKNYNTNIKEKNYYHNSYVTNSSCIIFCFSVNFIPLKKTITYVIIKFFHFILLI